MLNVVLTTKKSKSKIVERFIRSRGIEKYIPLFDCNLLFDTLLTTDSCNLHIFDFMFDLGTINTIRDFRDKINILNVYVTSVDSAKAYLSLTDNVFIIPDVYDILSWFWDSDACKASNVMGFDAMNYDFCKVVNPTTEGKTKSLLVEIDTQPVPLKYITADGRAVSTEGSQLVLKCKTKSSRFDLRALATRDQNEVYNHKQRSLADLPAGAIPEQVTAAAEKRKQSINGAIFAEVKKKDAEVDIAPLESQPNTEPAEVITDTVPKILVDEKRGSGLFARKDKPRKQKKKSKVITSDESYVSFSNFSAGTQGADYAANKVDANEIVAKQNLVEEHYDSIAAFCLAHDFVTIDDHDRLAQGLSLSKFMSIDDQWANKALTEGFITEEQLIQATMAVKNIGILSWEEIEKLEPDFSTFSIDKCQKFRFFKLVDDSTTDRATLIYSASLASLNPELYRMYDNPIAKVTLDVYIERKLKEYEK